MVCVGIAVIGNKLTEINVTSPTCICEIELEKKISISSMLIDYIEENHLIKKQKCLGIHGWKYI